MAGALLAIYASLFPANPEVALLLDNYQLWLLVIPFGSTACLYMLYVAPLFRAKATVDTYRGKILDFPLYFVFITIFGWLSSFFQGVILLWIVAPHLPFRDILLGNFGVFGISFISMAIGYFLFEYLNRTYWIPKIFQNRLEYYKDQFQPSIHAKFRIYHLGFSVAPIIFLGWIIAWIDSNHQIISDAQYAYILIFIIFIIVTGTKITGIFSRLFQVPLLQARAATDRIAAGDFDVNVTVHSCDELGVLGERINDMAANLKGNAAHIQQLHQELEQTQREVIFTMGAIGESRSKETGNHVKRVAEYSCLLAKAYNLSIDQAELLKQVSPMHDIGKVAIPDAILNKPGRLSSEEFAVMKTHASIGYEMLCHSSRKLLKAAAIVAHQHHEKFDGSGYPVGLVGEQIHIYGRITAVADVFDALGSARVYKPAWRDEDIYALFREQSGRHFDPRLIELFFANLDGILTIRKKFADIENY
ncbi:HD domain-containing phosphohydrolase [Candidatus Symbiobacter mobilis]|nr:HD domain-containing phosphohydrolase [Candidatus Symbiobacter mobilis]